jgi:hypothetical protein
MAVNTLQQIFVQDLEELIFPGLEFTEYAQNHDQFVVGNKVNVPNYVGAVTSVKNPTASSTPNVRQDNFVDYTIDYFATDATRIDLKDELQTNYSLRESSVRAHGGSLTELAKDGILHSWAEDVTQDRTFDTSGATSSLNLPAGASGSRKSLTKDDLRKVAKQMDKDRMPKQGRYVMIPADMYYELFTDGEILSFESMNKKTLPDGVITNLFGLNIMPSDQVIYFDGTTLIETKDLGSATASTLKHAALAWSETSVAKAFGGVDVFIDERDPKNYGASFFSAGLLFGSKALRGSSLDNEGVYVIKQG